ncbi:MAG: DUF2442 domain-containing protein [Muribaculaceae bacterium]|nr:DUF2442 domain-containing protein [Muribaculaceae bacterium]
MDKTKVNRVWLDDYAVWVELIDGRKAKEDFADYSRLASSTPSQRKNFRLSHFGIHWPEIDEDLSFEGFFNNK